MKTISVKNHSCVRRKFRNRFYQVKLSVDGVTCAKSVDNLSVTLQNSLVV